MSHNLPNDTCSRDLFAHLALSYLPHLVQLVDTNPHSPTYGCFDREYWHYRTLDFPCGMSQEFVLPFALLYRNPYPGNRYRGWERMREIAVSGIDFARKSSYSDGSCDDYFPYERAMGAMAFSTYACAEAYRVLGLQDEKTVDFFKKRCAYFRKHNESGRLSNHQALTALAAYTVYEITREEWIREMAWDRARLALSWQHSEGWFQEYEGADPGYQTCTLDFLAKLYQKTSESALLGPLEKGVEFASHFMHPDGSYGGEYGSRNTYHYYPHGFEILAPFVEKAARLNDTFLKGAMAGKRAFNEDDRLCCHLVYNWLQAYDDYRGNRPPASLHDGEGPLRWFPGAGMVVCHKKSYYAVSNLKKGGVTKVFSNDACVGSDTGLIVELDGGKTLVTHLMDEKHVLSADPEKGHFSVEGVFSVRSTKLSSPSKLILFRLITLTVGRFFPNLVRFLLQKVLITGKKRTKYAFKRHLTFGEKGVTFVDEFPQAMPVRRISVGPDATSIYVAASHVYQESVLSCPWVHGNEELVAQIRKGIGRWERSIVAEVPSERSEG